MMKKVTWLFILTLGMTPAVLAPLTVSAQQTEARIEGIRVEGAQRIEPATVYSYLTLKQGDAFDPVKINESLKSLFGTGFFSDISFLREDNVLIVKVTENPIINEIAFEGNNRVKDEELQAETQLRSRIVYTRAKVQEDIQRLLQIYRRMGNYAATIDPKIIRLDQNRVNLVYEIHEGDKTKVQTIKFVGNKKFSDDVLRDSIQTKESRWYRFLTSDDNYDQDRVSYDEELLRKFYLSKGYADFSVRLSMAELTPDEKDFFITYTITEGDRYRLGSVDVNNNLRGVNMDALQPSIRTVAGEWYNADQVDKTVLDLTDALANQQFAFVDIRPTVELDREKREVNLAYNIAESPRVFVERINIVSNTRTLDEVVRREMLLVEGDPFNKTKLKRSENAIRDLGFFRDVSVKTTQGSRPDQAVITITVAEQSTGEFSIGAGFSTNDGPLADFRIREKNLLGKGQDLQLSTTLSGRTNLYELRFTEPYFLDRKLAAGIDLFHIDTDFQDVSSFDQTRTGAGVRMGYPLSEHWRQDFRYGLEQNEIRDVNPLASLYIRQQEGERISSTLGHIVTYSDLDSRLDPTDGLNVTINNDIAGLGRDVRYLANKIRATNYYPITEDKNWIFVSGAEAGYIFGLSQDIRIDDRYFLGGNNFKGFDVAGIGARDITTGDALGGNRYAKGSVELVAPMGGATKELGLRSHFFSEFGTLGQIDSTGPGIADENSLRLAVGVGVSWRSPLGPLRGDLAIPVMKEDYDEDRIFNFNFGTRF